MAPFIDMSSSNAMEQEELQPLALFKAGQQAIIAAIEPGEASIMAIRMGLVTGECITVLNRQPGGATVIRHANAELALGRPLCQGILVRVSTTTQLTG